MRKTVVENADNRARKLAAKRAWPAIAGGLFVSCVAGAADAEPIQTVFVIAMENHNWTQPASLTSPQQISATPPHPLSIAWLLPATPMPLRSRMPAII